LSLAESLQDGTLELAKKFKRDPCAHAGIVSPKECIIKLIGNKNIKKLFLATQDKDLRKTVRLIPCVPLIYFKHNIMTLDPPTQATLIKAQRVKTI
jgi:U3 small nucleolar RNA-associated protein 23